MKALPQQPGPDGSRVVKRRSSIPRLGDNLVAITTHKYIPTKTIVKRRDSDASAILTSSNLDQHTKATQSGGDLSLLVAPSVCSDEDIILLGRFNQAAGSETLSRSSTSSNSPRVYETCPTTNEDNSLLLSSDGETVVNTSPPTSTEEKNGTVFIPFLAAGLKNSAGVKSPTLKIKLQATAASGLPARKEARVHKQPPVMLNATNKSLRSFESASIHTTVEANPKGETISNTKTLHSIVRGFLATDAGAKNVFPPNTAPQQPAPFDPDPTDGPKPFWDLQRIFDFYLRGAISAAKAKETAKRYGFHDAVHVLDSAAALAEKDPSLHVATAVLKAAKEGTIGDIKVPFDIPVAKPYEPRDFIRQKLAQKLSMYGAEDRGSARQLHIFVDMSNIHVGFGESWKISQNIPLHQHMRAPAFNFKVLSSIMERNRVTKKKILVGSVAHNVSTPAQWPRHLIEAQAQGYKLNILHRVQKISSGRPRGRHTGNIDLTSSDESIPDQARVIYATRNGEQGVDEILHLNMMDSVLDQINQPGTMILATGDAARAEFSDGFLQYAIRALDLGWNMELVTWRKTISSAWTNPKFRTKYGQRFRIIYLDEFLEELNEDLCPLLA
ncbi:hypothetical protein GGR50DRAFT_698753 [Xylaria sp. CBS 124048]|nr:hypothetical protein GGR50DRAFT_698753 [Xylaria sp. CBS 124048]